MNATTEHLKALLVDDGREFAMVRKSDLKALMITIGKGVIIERKHGEERRRYMANNKALLARNARLEASEVGLDKALDDLFEVTTSVMKAIRKAPATCRMLGLIK